LSTLLRVDHRGKATQFLADKVHRYLPSDWLVVKEQLQEADVQWESRYGTTYLELKLASDFASSIISKHMIDQETRMLELDGTKAVVVIGLLRADDQGRLLAEVGGNHTGQYYRTIDGKCWKLFQYPYVGMTNYMIRLQERGIAVIYVPYQKDLPRMVGGMVKRSLKSRSEFSSRVVTKTLSNEASAIRLLYPALSQKAALNLYMKFGSPRLNLTGISIKELMEIPGLGRTGAKKLLDSTKV
jgi:ERCC4-type nuclease